MGRFPIGRGDFRTFVQVDAAFDFFEVAGAEIGEESAVAEDFVVDLLLGKPAAETEFDERANGQASCPVGTEGALLDGVAVDQAAFAMGRDGDAAAHVGHNQAQRFVGTALLAGKTPGHGAGV